MWHMPKEEEQRASMNRLSAPHAYGSAQACNHTWVCQRNGSIRTAYGGPERMRAASVTAAEAATTAAVAALTAANAAQNAAFAANAVLGVGQSCANQRQLPFPARRRKLRPDDSWLTMAHQQRCGSCAWDGDQARSHKRQSDDFGAQRGPRSKTRRLGKQHLQPFSQPQEKHRVGRNNFNRGDAGAEAGGHRTKSKVQQPRSTGHAGTFGGKASPAQRSPEKRNQAAAAYVLKLLEQAVSESTQTFPEESTGLQTESFQDEAATEFKHE
mmetsp:Transcript_72996/g.144671  ORF Transcript_72996/g.144671 Transcript_72996/m.144671 type:complete len:269 (-) Transcript_72996:237-1043(-)